MEVPQPKITWRREDGKSIFRDPEKKVMQSGVNIFQGEFLDLQVVLSHYLQNVQEVFFNLVQGVSKKRWTKLFGHAVTYIRVIVLRIKVKVVLTNDGILMA